MSKFLKSNKIKFFLVAVLIIIILVVAIGGGNKDEGVSKYVVDFGSVSDTLVLSGEVEPVQEVEMAFPVSGLVERVYKSVGDEVKPGDKIIELDNRSLRADLADALARLELERAELRATEGGLGDVTSEQDTLVKNARIKLLSDGLFADTNDSNTQSDAPIVSGAYTSDEQGIYKIELISGVGASRLDMRFYGLEIGRTPIEFTEPVPLGTRGLFVTFEEGQTSTGDEWFVRVPNINGTNYVANLNAYNNALAARETAINNAKEDLVEDSYNSSIVNARIKQAEANVAKIRAQIAERTLTATFAGVVGNIDVREGEIAGAGNIVAKVMSSDAYQVVVQIPEIDIINVVQNLVAEIKLDAYGDDVIFPGTVVSIDSSETEVDGVSVYEARVSFDNPDGRIRSGMTADVSIQRDSRQNVLRLPVRFMDKDEVGDYVLVENGEEKDKVYLKTGLVGTDGFVEIVSGVDQGDVIIGEFAE